MHDAPRRADLAAWQHLRVPELLRIMRFVANGLFNTALSYILFIILLRFGLTPFPALLFSTGTTILVNFQTSRRLVFRSEKAGTMRLFVSAYILLFLIDYLVLSALAAMGMPNWAAQGVIVIPLAVATYAVQRNIVFK